MTAACAVIPAYNEASRIGDVIRASLPYVTEVIVVDDGSTDETGAVAREAGAVVIRHHVNCGAGAATMTCIEAARRRGHTVVVTIDADGQHNPADIPALLGALEAQGADLVIADRFAKDNSIPFIRRIFNGVGNLVTLAATGLYFSDSQCGFKVFGPKATKQIDLRMRGFEFCTEIVREASKYGWRVVSVPAKVVYSEYTLAKGQSFANGIRTAAKILLRSFLR